MNLYYSLANSLSPEKIIRDIDSMITKFIDSGGDSKNSVMIIQIQTLTDHTGDSLLPKLPYKNTGECST